MLREKRPTKKQLRPAPQLHKFSQRDRRENRKKGALLPGRPKLFPNNSITTPKAQPMGTPSFHKSCVYHSKKRTVCQGKRPQGGYKKFFLHKLGYNAIMTKEAKSSVIYHHAQSGPLEKLHHSRGPFVFICPYADGQAATMIFALAGACLSRQGVYLSGYPMPRKCSKGKNTSSTLPRIYRMSTGPRVSSRLSLEWLRLSPMTKTLPSGTTREVRPP